MKTRIRPAEHADAAAIRVIHLAAFATRQEADLIEQLERDGDSVISIVAEEGGEIVGHVVMSRMRVDGGGRGWRALALGPVAVLPKHQLRGVGGALIREALALARSTGEELIFVVGEPAYYQRFGFSAEMATRFESPYAGPYLMAQALGDAPKKRAGRAGYAPAFAALG